MIDEDGLFYSSSQKLKFVSKHVCLFSVVLLVLALIIPVCSATSIQKFGIDSKTYTACESISLTGEILYGNASGQVKISILENSVEYSNITVFASSSAFSGTISAPAAAGNYTILATDLENSSTSPTLSFKVLGINDPESIDVLLTVGEVLVVPLSSSHGITGPVATGKTGGSISFRGNTYYFLVSNNNVAYMDDDTEMNLSSDSSGNMVIGNLVEGSKVKLNATTYTLTHINNDTEIVMVRPVEPKFNGGETVNVTLLALNSSDVPLSTTMTLDYVTDNGTLISRSTKTSVSNGLVTSSVTIETNAGIYHLIAGDVGHRSFVVNTADMFGDVLSEEYEPKHTFAVGDDLVAAVYLKNIATGVSIETATVTARIRSAENASIVHSLTLTYDTSTSAYTHTYTIPSTDPVGVYDVEYTAVVGSQTQKAYTYYEIKTYDLFLKAVSKNKDESDGFAPGEEGFLIIAGTDLSTGDRLNIEASTDLNISKFAVNITNIRGTDVTSDWSLMNLSTFYAYMDVPIDVQADIEQKLGDNVTIINFTAPSTTGIYDVVVEVYLSDWASARTSFSVQDFFVHGEPVNRNGWFSPKVAPYSYARLMIMAFDPSTGELLTEDKINDAGLVEVWSQSADDVVTEYMVNASLESIDDPFMGTIKVLKFQANDSYLGFHHVKFWVNATVDGTPKTAIGDGWFDEKLYTIRAKPAADSNTGMFKVFGSDDDIELDVRVQDISSNNVSSATIEIESVNYGMTGETVEYTVNTTSSSTTDTNGETTISFTPSSSLKSGFYNVRLKMTTQDGTIDYGNGWFEVSNFIFFPYSSSWDVGLDTPINFTLNVFDSDFSDKTADVTLTKIISMGDWEMMTPPSVCNETIVSVGSVSGTGYYEYTEGLSEGGNYEFVFEADDGNSTEIGRACVHVTPFITWVDTDGQYEFSTSGFMNFTVKAAEDKWGGGNPHNITDVTVEKVMQEGIWMTTYQNKSAMASLTTTEAGTQPNEINVSINTTGWGQGTYSMRLKVTDADSNEVYANFWFRLRLASVSVPELMRKTINGGQYYTNSTSINATTDIMSKRDYFASIGNVSAGKVAGQVIGENSITMIVGDDEDRVVDTWNHSQVPYFAMVVVDTIHKTVYLEFEDQTEPRDQYYNLSDSTTTQVFNASAGDSFIDYTGREWRILEITSDGTVKLEGVNTLKNGLMLDSDVMAKTLSGKFLMGKIWDEQWCNLDLDGDGEYFGDESYNILMSDSEVSGKYNTIYISNIANFSSGTYIDASAGSAIEFGGDPIYLLSNKYQSGAYRLEFTTYRRGWDGMHLGTYANGSVLKIPFLVQTPSGLPIAGSNVKIDFLMDEGRETFALSGINNTTDANGLTIISINTTENPVDTGKWRIHYNATVGSGYVVADEEMFWEMPQFELRDFIVSGSLGIPGSIDLIQIKDDNPEDGLLGDNMLLGYGDEIEFKRGIGVWFQEDDRYQLEYPFDQWYYNSTTGDFNYSTDDGNTLLSGMGDLVNTSNARSVLNFNVTSCNDAGDTIVLNSGSNSFYDDMWIFNVTSIETDNSSATIAMSYKGWPWTLPDADPWEPGPETQTFPVNESWWIGGLDFTVAGINSSNDTVILELNRPVFVASADAMSDLMDDDTGNGEMDKMRGSVNTVTFNSQEYLVYGYEDVANTSRDLCDDGWIETMDRVLVENTDTGVTNIYRIGENITELNNYYAAAVSEWGGKLLLLNSNVTQIYPIPQWTSDAPIYYVGVFSDEDLGVDLATVGLCDDEKTELTVEISSDDRYSILMYDVLPNGVNFPSEAIYDDDPDLTMIGGWNGQSAYDMYDQESGYGDAISTDMGYDIDNIEYINMFEQTAWSIGTGNMESWPLAIPTINVNNTAKTATAMTFSPKFEIGKNDDITIYISARAFDGTPVNGVAEMTQLKMMYGGSFMEGMYDDLPRTYTISGVNVTLSDGEGLLEVTSDDLPDDLEFDFGEFTALVTVTSQTGGTETLKINFFMVDWANVPDFGDEMDDGGDK